MQLISLYFNNTEQSARLRRSNEAVSQSVARLSSGNRITRAADDVAGLSVATRLLTRTTALRSAATNIAQASSLLQVADDALGHMNEALQRMEAIATQASSGVLGPSERSYLDIEFQGLKQEIDHLLEETRFNGKQLFKAPDVPDAPEGTTPEETEALFVPTNIGNNILWLDAADTDSITDAGGLVSLWEDKSGNGHDMTAAGAVRPTTGAATINNQNVISNTAGHHFLANPFNDFPTTEISVFTTVQTNTNSRSIMSYAVPGTDNEFLLFGRNAYLNGPNTFVLGNFLDNMPHALGVTWQSMGGNLDSYMDGGNVSSTSFQSGNPLTANGALSILGEQDAVGGGFVSSQDFVGNIGEIFIYDNVLSTDERELVDMYQSAKWDMPLALTGTTAARPGIYSDGYTVSRFAPEGTLVGDLTEVLGNVPFSYSITGGNDNNLFHIDPGTGEITVANSELLSATSQNNLTLTVQANLGGTEPLELDVNILLTNDGSLGLNGGFIFQIGASTENLLIVDIGNIDLSDVLSDTSISVLTADAAREAFDVLAEGIHYITDRRAYVGSKQSQADIIVGAVFNQLQNQDHARAVLADTDITKASTAFAQQQVQNEMTISITAQATELQERSVLDMIDAGTGNTTG